MNRRKRSVAPRSFYILAGVYTGAIQQVGKPIPTKFQQYKMGGCRSYETVVLGEPKTTPLACANEPKQGMKVCFMQTAVGHKTSLCTNEKDDDKC